MRCWLVFGCLLPAAIGATAMRWHAIEEPLDCDEAAYTYIGRRLLQGDVLYVDVIENKPPLAYVLYASAVQLGDYSERSIRLLAFPFVLAALLGVAGVAYRWFGARSAAACSFFFAAACSDPFLFADSSNLEVFLNGFLVLSLWAAVYADADRPRRWCLVGFLVACGTLAKQSVLLHLGLYACWILISPRHRTRRLASVTWLSVGFLGPCLATCIWALWGRNFERMIHYIFFYGPSMAGETQAEGATGRMVQFFVGRPDDRWWGTGTWPLLICSLVAVAMLFRNAPQRASLVGSWLIVCALEVFLPGLNWQHYFLLLLPGLCLLASSILAVDESAATGLGPFRFLIAGLTICSLAYLQWFHYLRWDADEIMIRNKGGEQWVLLRDIGRQLGDSIRSAALEDPRIFVWGIQTPLYVYSGLDSPTAKVLADPLQQKYLNHSHPLVDPIRAQIVSDLHRDPPEVVFVGAPPFVQLSAFLRDRYVSTTSQTSVESSQGRGLYLRKDVVSRLAAARNRGASD